LPFLLGVFLYILYLDEYGNPDDWSQNRNFVLAGVAVFEGEIQRFTDAVDSVQSTFFPQVTTPFEFHAGHMNKGKARWPLLQRFP